MAKDDKPTTPGPNDEVTFDSACRLLESVLEGDTRRKIIAKVSKGNDFRRALVRLRDCIRFNLFNFELDQLYLDKLVQSLDELTRTKDAFHVLHDWDGIADRLNEDTIPLDIANWAISTGAGASAEDNTLAVLLDYYFFYLLTILSMRVWDEGSADQNLDRVTGLVGLLQGPNGSRLKFVDNAETLMFVATSHYEPDESAYDRLLVRIRTLDREHRNRVALVHGAILASHLRFGFEASYKRDIANMRSDNAADYPWLCFALATLMSDYVGMRDDGIEGTERYRVVEGIVNALTPDVRAFVGAAPASLGGHADEHTQLRERLLKFSSDLCDEFKRHRPTGLKYSPISFFFNFPHNILKGVVVHAVLRGLPSGVTLNDLLTGLHEDEEIGEAATWLATTLMGYARANPDTIAGKPTPAVVYDPSSGLKSYSKAIRVFKQYGSEPTPTAAGSQ